MSVGNERPISAGERVPGSERIYDLVASDVDGTLVTSENKLSTSIAPLIHETQARGIGVTLVSGRPKLKMMPLMKELGLTLPYIGSGGAYIANPLDQAVIYTRSLAPAEGIEIVELARATQAPIIPQESSFTDYQESLGELEQL